MLHPAQEPGSVPAIEMLGAKPFLAHWVGDGLLLGNLPYLPTHVDALAEQGVGMVVNLCEDKEYWDGQRPALEVAYAWSGVDERRIPLRDVSAPTPRILTQALAVGREACERGLNLAVHCFGGRERSATLITAIRADTTGEDVWKTLRAIQRIAPYARPLGSQQRALARWQAARSL